MIKKISTAFSTTISQRFFIEKSLELLNHETIDSYRLRLNNSITALDELISVTDKLLTNQIKNKVYLTEILDELCELLMDDPYFKWGGYDKNYLFEAKKNPEVFYKKINIYANSLKKLNKSYIETIFGEIRKEIQRLNSKSDFNVDDLTILNKIIPRFWISIVRRGCSRPYLYRLLNSWIVNTSLAFESFLDRVSSLSKKIEEEFTIVFAIKGIPSAMEVFNNDLTMINDDTKSNYSELNKSCEKFFKIKDGEFILIKTKALDYYSAVMKVKPLLNSELDKIHFSKPNFQPKIYRHVLVIGSNEPQKANLQNYYYQIEGYYQHNLEVYETISKKLNNLEAKNIHKAAVEKLKAGLMYYRMGSESTELHSKLLNYWIGMEFIFSGYESTENTILRLKRYYSKLQSLLLFKRVLLNFHHNIKSLEISHLLENYSKEDINYLFSKNNFLKIIDQYSQYPLIAFRAKMIKDLFDDEKLISKMAHRSKINVERNLTRIYRIRNEIVHNASSIAGIETIVSHLKFYLLNTIYSIIHFFDDNADDYNFDGKIDIDDFFEIREMKFDNLFPKNDSKVDIEVLKLFKVPLEKLFQPQS